MKGKVKNQAGNVSKKRTKCFQDYKNLGILKASQERLIELYYLL